MTNLYFSICAFFCILLVIVLFYSKKRIESKETKIYGIMIISSLIDVSLVLIVLSVAYCFGTNATLFLIKLINKFDFIHYIIWPSLMLLYIHYITYNNEKKYNKLKKSIIYFDLLSIFIEFLLPVEIINVENTMGVEGTATIFVYSIAVIYLFIIIWILLFNIKKTFNRKYMPVMSLILFMFVAVIVRVINPTLIVLPAIIVYINLIMYFTIENPDVKLLEQVSLAKDQAEKANAAKTDFLSSMSHEIRTPLNAIVGFSEAIQEEDTLEAAKQDAKDIILASQNLLELVNGILDISKLEANKMEIINNEYDLRTECQNLMKLIKPRLGEKPIDLNLTIAQDVPNTLYGDKSKIKEIMSNLLTNAAKYTEKGYIKTTINCINKNDECSLVISVEDTGRGIKPEQIDKLFNKFERLEEDRNTTIEGAGLGLAITKRLVELMDGKIVVQSVYGSGSKFTVYIKQLISKNKKTLMNHSTNTKLELYDKKVLIVDDNDLNIKIAERMLTSYGICVEKCSSGLECLELVKSKHRYDLILMDDMMPKMSGTETLHVLKELPTFKDKVVVLTANAIEGMRDKYLAEGFEDYISKPIEKKELERVLRKFLTKEIDHIDFEPLPSSMYEIADSIVEKLNQEENK